MKKYFKNVINRIIVVLMYIILFFMLFTVVLPLIAYVLTGFNMVLDGIDFIEQKEKILL